MGSNTARSEPRAESEPLAGPQTSEPRQKPARQDIQALVSLYKGGHLKDAETRARQLIGEYPRTLVLFDILTGSLISQGKAEEAVVACEQALAIDPDYAPAYNNLGAALGKRRSRTRPSRATSGLLSSSLISPRP